MPSFFVKQLLAKGVGHLYRQAPGGRTFAEAAGGGP